MSQLPQRKHTLEELAALRGTDFPSPESVASPVNDQPAVSTALDRESVVHLEPEHHRYMPPVKHGVHSGFEGHLPEVTHPQSVLPPVHAVEQRPRHIAPEKSGVTHAFDGLKPDSANENVNSPIIAHSPVANTALPQRKHDEREILDMRRRDAFQTRPPVAQIVRQALNPIMAGILYLIAAVIVYLTIHFWDAFPPQKYIAPSVGCSFLLIVSLIIYLKKSRARHHAAFLCGIACLTLGFVILLTIKSPYAA